MSLGLDRRSRAGWESRLLPTACGQGSRSARELSAPTRGSSPSALRIAVHSFRDLRASPPDMPRAVHFATKEPNAPLPARYAACQVRQAARKTHAGSTAAGSSRELEFVSLQVFPFLVCALSVFGLNTILNSFRRMGKPIRLSFRV